VKFRWILCSLADLDNDPSGATCEIDKVFLPEEYDIPPFFTGILGIGSVRMLPVQMHSVLLGMFASLVAPFGGFFASAIKRAYDIKDFDALIPGHGGIMVLNKPINCFGWKPSIVVYFSRIAWIVSSSWLWPLVFIILLSFDQK